MTTAAIEVRAVDSRTDLDYFINLPRRLYRDDPLWVAPLDMDVRKVLDRTAHPFHQHAEVAPFIAIRGRAVVGRIAAIVNHAHNEFHQDKVGFFGLFESDNDQAVADALLRRAEEWLRARGRDKIRGPMNLSTNDELFGPGVLIDGFDSPPMIMTPHTPRYYATLLESSGYGKAKDLFAYWKDASTTPERLLRAMQRTTRNSTITLRTLSLRDFDAEVARMKAIYNASWERNWGFVPMTDAEFNYLAKQLRPIVDPKLIMIAQVAGEPIGFLIQLPDYNQALKHVNGKLLPFGVLKFLWHKRKINQMRVLTLGVKPEYRGRGIESLLMAQQMEVLQGRDMARGEASWILEDNHQMRHIMERMGGIAYKTYRIFEKPL